MASQINPTKTQSHELQKSLARWIGSLKREHCPELFTAYALASALGS